MKTRTVLFLGVISHFMSPTLASAQWATDGNVLCGATGSQFISAALPDGAGGAFVVWFDARSGDYDIYAQRVDAWGVVQWMANGIPVRAAANDQTRPAIVADGADGAIIIWQDQGNNGNTDIVAQRVDADGVLQWGFTGAELCGAQHDQFSPSAVTDGAGGAIVTWQDNRSGSNMVADIYVQRVNGSGIVQWTSDGVAISTADDAQTLPTLVDDGAGGAIITWSDNRGGPPHIYAQRVNSAGVALWTTDGVLLGPAFGNDDAPQTATDGAGGAIVAWTHNPVGTGAGIYAPRVSPSGGVQWTIGGTIVCDVADTQFQPQIISDGAGGAIIGWVDFPGIEPSDMDVYAQRVNGSGAGVWLANGVPVCTAAGVTTLPRLVPDGAGGAVIAFTDRRNLNYDIYAQRISDAGEAHWAANGVALCTETSSQFGHVIVSDGFGGAIVSWIDYRSGTTDIYANRVSGGGAIPTAIDKTPALSLIAGNSYPNPFSTETAIELTLSEEQDVSVEIFDVAGRRVRAMNMGRVSAGTTPLRFDGRDELHNRLPSGVYFCRIHAGSETITRKMVIQR
jgi:hypothetical protein